jgi:hypothetical protein
LVDSGHHNAVAVTGTVTVNTRVEPANTLYVSVEAASSAFELGDRLVRDYSRNIHVEPDETATVISEHFVVIKGQPDLPVPPHPKRPLSQDDFSLMRTTIPTRP